MKNLGIISIFKHLMIALVNIYVQIPTRFIFFSFFHVHIQNFDTKPFAITKKFPLILPEIEITWKFGIPSPPFTLVNCNTIVNNTML